MAVPDEPPSTDNIDDQYKYHDSRLGRLAFPGPEHRAAEPSAQRARQSPGGRRLAAPRILAGGGTHSPKRQNGSIATCVARATGSIRCSTSPALGPFGPRSRFLDSQRNSSAAEWHSSSRPVVLARTSTSGLAQTRSDQSVATGAGRYRAVLDSSVDPEMVIGWMSQVQAERLAGEAVLVAAAPSEPLSAAGLRQIIEELGNSPRSSQRLTRRTGRRSTSGLESGSPIARTGDLCLLPSDRWAASNRACRREDSNRLPWVAALST